MQITGGLNEKQKERIVKNVAKMMCAKVLGKNTQKFMVGMSLLQYKIVYYFYKI